MLGPGVLQTRRKAATTGKGSFFKKLLKKGKDKTTEETESVAEEKKFSREVRSLLDESQNLVVGTKYSTVLDEYEGLLKGYALFNQAKAIAMLGDLDDTALTNMNEQKDNIENHAAQLRNNIISQIDDLFGKKILSNITGMRLFEAAYKTSNIYNEVTKKEKFIPSELYGPLYEQFVVLFGNFSTDICNHYRDLLIKAPSNIARLVDDKVAGVERTIERALTESGVTKNLINIKKSDVRDALEKYENEKSSNDEGKRYEFMYKKVKIEDFEEKLSLLPSEETAMFIDMNKKVLIGALKILKEGGLSYSEMDSIDPVEALNKYEKAQEWERSKIGEELTNNYSINLENEFIYHPLTDNTIRKLKVVELAEDQVELDGEQLRRTKTIRDAISNGLNAAVLKPREGSREKIDKFEDLADIVHSKIVDYAKGTEIVREWKNFAIMMMRRVEMNQDYKTLENKSKTSTKLTDEEKEVKRNLTRMIEETNAILAGKFFIETYEVPLAETVDSTLVDRVFAESKRKYDNLTSLYDDIYNNNGVPKTFKIIAEKEADYINSQYASAKLASKELDENITAVSDVKTMNSIFSDVEKIITGTIRLYRDGNELGKNAIRTLEQIRKLGKKFEGDLRTNAQYTGIMKAQNEGEIITNCQGNLAKIVTDYNKTIFQLKDNEIKNLKETYGGLCAPEKSFDLTSLLLNFGTIIEKMKYVADKQENEKDADESYAAINELQQKMGLYLSPMYKSGLWGAKRSISEREFIENCRFYFEEIIGQKGTNGIKHPYNNLYQDLCVSLKTMMGPKGEFSLLTDLVALEKTRSEEHLFDDEKGHSMSEEHKTAILEVLETIR